MVEMDKEYLEKMMKKLDTAGIIKELRGAIIVLTNRLDDLEGRVTELDDPCAPRDTEAPKSKPPGPMLIAPDLGRVYFVLNEDGRVNKQKWNGVPVEFGWLTQGNVFRTREDAEKESKARELRHEMRVWAARNGWVADWLDYHACNARLWFNHYQNGWRCTTSYGAQGPGAIYLDPDDFDALIEKFGDRLRVLL